MSILPCKTLIQTISRNSIIHIYALRIPFPKSFSHISEFIDPPSPTVNYLINSCGLSPETALSASKQIRDEFITTEKPDSVLKFLETNNFSKTHTAKLISTIPQLLSANVDETLKPNLKQFYDSGLSGSKLAELIASDPNILSRAHKILPRLEFIRRLVRTEENIIKAVKRTKWLLTSKVEEKMQPNIDLLRLNNVPDSSIAYLIMNQAISLMVKTEELKESVEIIKRLGFEPESKLFACAINVMWSMKKSTWNSKMKFLKDHGWSEEEVFSAFRRMPFFMVASEKKIKEMMDFFRKMLNWDVRVICSNPLLLKFSLKERVIPRFKIYQILKAKELVREEKELIVMLRLSEKDFLKKYVTKYQDEVLDLLKVYKSDKSDFGCDFTSMTVHETTM